MNLANYLEDNKRLLLGGLFIVCAGILALTAWRDPLSFDAFWHLQAGKDWLVNGLDPWHDHSSFTFNGAEIIGPPYLFQATLFGFVEWFGMPGGFQAFKFLSYLLIFACMLFYLRAIRSPAWLYFLVLPTLLVLIQLRSMVRPELISYALTIMALWLYWRAGPKPRTVHLLGITLLMWFWTNYHTAIVGYVIFAAFFLDYGLALLKDRAPIPAWMRWFGWGVVVVAVGFLNYGFDHVILGMFQFDPAWKELIQEYESPLIYAHVTPLWFLLALAVFTMIACILQKRWGYLLIAAFLTFSALDMVRMLTSAGIIILCLFAVICVETDWNKWLEGKRQSVNWLVLGLALALFAVPFSTSLKVSRELLAHNFESDVRYPHRMTRYMREQEKHGRIFNSYGLGGFLIYQLSPHNPVYIDGRTNILYPAEHLQTQQQALDDPELLRSEIDKWDIDYIIEESKPGFDRYVLEHSDFELDFVDYRFLLFSRENAALAESGRLHVYPACWSDDLAPALIRERDFGLKTLPADITYVQFLGLLGAYSEANDRPGYLAGIPTNLPFSDPIHRFIGYRAMELGRHEQAIAMFVAIREKHVSDYLAAVQAGVMSGDTNLAARLWQETQSILPGNLFEFEQVIVNRLESHFSGASTEGKNPADWGTSDFCTDS